MGLLVILADISPIFTFCSGQFIVSFIYLSKILYVMLSIGVKVKVLIFLMFYLTNISLFYTEIFSECASLSL